MGTPTEDDVPLPLGAWLPSAVPWGDGPGEAPPCYLTRSDGRALLYEAKVNSIIGPSEQGKSWIALFAVKQAIAAGKYVEYIDLESDGGSIAGRLTQMGVPRNDIYKHVAYVQPDARYLPGYRTPHGHLVVVDGLNALYGIHGVDYNSSTEVTQLHNLIFKPWADAGRCVVIIDHTPKNTQPGQGAGAIGSQAKRATISGVSLKVQMTEAFGRKRLGKATVFVDKDRPGHVRGLQADDASVAQLVVDDTMGTMVTLGPSPWVAKAHARQDRQVSLDKEFANALALGPLSRTGLADNLSMGAVDSRFRDNLQRLIHEGRIRTEKVGKNVMHSWV